MRPDVRRPQVGLGAGTRDDVTGPGGVPEPCLRDLVRPGAIDRAERSAERQGRWRMIGGQQRVEQTALEPGEEDGDTNAAGG